MVLVKLMGGLGNQLFQYAAGRSLASRLATTLKLDTSFYPRQTLRAYMLSHFQIQAEFASTRELRRCTLSRRWPRLWQTLGLRPRYTMVKEKPFPNFVPDFFTVQGDVFLNGYWQSEAYFREVAPTIRREFAFKNAPDARNHELLAEIAGVNAVAVHVRRGDYLLHPATSQLHGTCSLDYYRRALEYIQKRVEQPHFFVFSDDPAWTQANMKMNAPTSYITHNAAAHGHEDLRLMTACRHFILANSSFSWWGAWLATSVNKVVLAPEQWFASLPLGAQAAHLIPSSWTRL